MGQKLKALVIDENSERRRLLKSMLRSIREYKDIDLVGTLNEALQKISESEIPVDILFMSANQDAEAVASFLVSSSELPKGKCMVVLSIIRSGGKPLSEEEMLLRGSHACISEPFSVDDLQEKTQLSLAELARVQQERKREVVRALVHRSIGAIDELAEYKKYNLPLGSVIAGIKEIGRGISAIHGPEKEFYYELILSMYPEAKVPEPLEERGDLTLQQRIAIRRAKLLDATKWKVSTKEEGETIIVVCEGDLSSNSAISEVRRILTSLLNDTQSSVAVDFAQAKNYRGRAINELVRQLKLFRAEKRSLKSLNDEGAMKGVIQKIKKALQESQGGEAAASE